MRVMMRVMFRAAIFLVLFICLAGLTSRAYAGVRAAPPPNFMAETVVADLDQPVDLAFAPDGRLFVVERFTGKILVVQPGAIAPDPTPLHTVAMPGLKYGEGGIFGMVLDPGFAGNGYFYVLYTKGTRDVVSRFTAQGNTTLPNSELVIWSDNVDAGEWHRGGGLAFGTDGKLYIAIGDHHDTNFTADHVSQRLDSYRGKILRINPDGTIPPDNPFYDGEDTNLDAIWALGLRNPFRMWMDLPTGRLLIADVGGNEPDSIEELNLGEAGANYGWPFCEGSNCTQPNITKPIFEYPHLGRDASITGGFVYRDGNFPPEYEGRYFFADYAQNWIRTLAFGPAGAVIANDPFEPVDGTADGPVGDIVALKQGPDGALYYLDLGVGWESPLKPGKGSVRRIKYAGDPNAPSILAISADPPSGPGPALTTTFTAEIRNPLGRPLSYTWSFGDGSVSDEANPQHTYTAKGRYLVRLVISDGENQAVSEPLVVDVGQRPDVTILTPADGTTFRAGEVITYTGTASDADGVLTAESYAWSVRFHHDDHVHPAQGPITGVTGSTFVAPASGHSFDGETGFEILLTVTDQDGLQASQAVMLTPDKVALQFQTDPPGLVLSVDQLTQRAPIAMTELKGYHIGVNAAKQQFVDGRIYDFVGWSDGGQPRHTIVVPDGNATFTAGYQEQKAAPGGSLFFNGAAGSVVRTTDLPLLANYTFEVWFKRLDSTGKDQVIMSDGNLFYTEAMFTLELNARQHLCSGQEGEIAVHGLGDKIQCSGVIAEIGRWYHVAVTRDSSRTRRIYVNGALASEVTDTPLPRNSSGRFSFGRAGDAQASYFTGFIDEARITNGVVYTGDFQPPAEPLEAGPSTLGLWHFDEGEGQSAQDSSPQRRHGTLGERVWSDPADPLWLSESPFPSSNSGTDNPPERMFVPRIPK